MEGGLAHQDAVDRSRGLKPGGGVDDVAGGHAFASGHVGAQHHERFAGVDADAYVQVQTGLLVVEPLDRGPNRECCAHRAFGIVLMCDRRPEQRHHGVADELLDGAAVVLQLVSQQRVVRSQRAAHVLHVHLLAAAGEPDQIRE